MANKTDNISTPSVEIVNEREYLREHNSDHEDLWYYPWYLWQVEEDWWFPKGFVSFKAPYLENRWHYGLGF